MAEHTGELIGRYRLIRKIGAGGFAEVYLAEHIHLNRKDAIKLLTNLSAGDMQNFREEARVIANLQHPHIIRVLDFDIEQGIPYLVMEYAPNGTLRLRHPKGARVDLLQIVTYVKQLASALQYAHTQRLIHRDVKPDNILIGRNGELLLGDFGAALATRTSLILNPQNIIGTAAYMAPEQLLGKAVAASDQYALGVMVYEWLCGNCPFEGSADEVQRQQLYMSPPSLLARMPELSPPIEQVVMRALSKGPAQRFESIQGFAEAFEQASKYRQASSPRLFLRGNDGGFANIQAPEVYVVQATPPSLPVIPPTQATPPPLSQIAPTQEVRKQLPVTVMAQPSYGAKPHRSRRTFLRIVGVAIVGSSVALAWEMTHPSKEGGSGGTQVTPTHPSQPPTPKPTTVPAKSDALYVYRGHQNEVFTAAWSPNGQYIASAGGDIGTRTGDTSVHIWRAMDGSDVYRYSGHSGLVRSVAWNHDGTYIASASEDETVQVWSVDGGGRSPVPYTGHTGRVMGVAWSPDGTRIASAGVDQTVQVWDAKSGNTIFTYVDPASALLDVAWSPDGKYIACASGDNPFRNDDPKTGQYMVSLLEASTGTVLRSFTHSAQIGCVAWSLDSNYIVSGDYNDDDEIRIWEISTGENIQAFSNKPAKASDPGGQIYSVAWSPHGQYVAAGSQDTQVTIWQTPGVGKREVLRYLGHNMPIMSVQWSPNGRYIASAGFDRTVQVWKMV
jgi:serine/threonine protein kinase/Tol biopolymer transport system component